MPLTLLIESELDERSATAAANRAERVYAEASRNISKSMTSQIGDGAREAGRAIDKMADGAQASYRKMLNAQDELAAAERQLKQMREDGARGVEIQAERVRQARKREKEAIREAASAMDDYERTTQRVGESGVRAGSLLRQGLRAGLEDGVSDYTRQFGVMGTIADTALSGISTKALVAGAGIGAIAVGAVAAGKALYDLGAQWDDISDSMTVATGKTGDELERMTDIVGDVGRTTAAPLGAIGQVAQQLAQNLPDLSQNDVAMRQMVSNLSYLNANGVAVDVRELGMAFRAFGIDANHSVSALDNLNTASQNSGIPLNELIASVRAGAPQFRQFGLSIGQSTGLLASFAQAGVAPEQAVTGLRTALKNVGGEGKDAATGLAAAVAQIKALHDAQNEGAAQQLAQDMFGTKNATAFLQVIESGALSVESLNKAMQDLGMSIGEQQTATDDWAQSLEKIKNTVAVGLKPVADNVFGTINSQLQLLAGNLGLADDKANALKDSMTAMAQVPIAADSALGRMLTPAGLPGSSTPGVATPGGIGNAIAGVPGSGITLPGGLLAPQWGSHSVSTPGGSSSSSGSNPQAPAVPYAPGYGRAPLPGESAAMYGAEQNVLEAQHRRATAEAALAQVMADATHTTNDEIKAQNDVAQAKKAEIDANLRLRETSAKAAESLNKATGQLSDFGATIDADFGASKGLPGILENIVKFVGNLALAGPMAQMNAISAANPNQGSGLMGMLASTGAFGPQYTPQAIAAASGQGGYGGAGYGPSQMGPAALQPGGPIGTARPGESAREFAHRVMMPFWQSQGLTVGDHAADKFGEHQNGALDIMVPSIAAGNSVLQQVLSDPNVYGAIFNNQAYGYGQGAAPRPYGGGFTGNPTQDHQDHVHAWYKPGGENNIVPGGPSVGGWQGPGLNPGMYSGGGGQSPVFSNPGGPGIGGAAGQDPFGVAPTTGPGGGGIGITPGGTIDTAIGIAAAGANMFAPGAGAAAQAGIKLASRAIQFGGQAAGIGLDGLMQTFLPQGSEKAGAGWLQRGVGALASVKPALPNLAGGKGSPKVNPQDQQGQQPGQPNVQGGDTNINVTNQRATEDGTGKDIAFHLGAQNSGPGW